MKRSYETPEVLNARNQEYRKKMRGKGFKYMSLWVPSSMQDKVRKMADAWKKDIS